VVRYARLDRSRSGIVAIEGPRGAGKTTLAVVVAREMGVRSATGPRPEPGETEAAFQLRVEEWMVGFVEGVPRGGVAVLDRGWLSTEVYRGLLDRPGPSARYASTFLPTFVGGVSVLLSASDETLDEARGRTEFLERERAAWRALDVRGVLRYRRIGAFYDGG